MKKLLLSLILTFLFFTYKSYAQQGNVNARALFYSGEGTAISHTSTTKTSSASNNNQSETSSKSSTQKYMGIAYWIDKIGNDGQIYRVNASSTFRGGDRIRLYVQTNRDGYLYVYNIGTTGNTNLLFPTPNSPDNFVRAYQPISIPNNGFIRFDFNPGTERILIMLSPNPMNIGTHSSAATVYTTPPQSYTSPQVYGSTDSKQYVGSNKIQPSGYIATDRELNEVVSKITIASRDLFVEEVGSAGYNNPSRQGASSAGSRDLIVEEGAPLRYDMPATYIVSPVTAFDGGRLISHEIKLRHK